MCLYVFWGISDYSMCCVLLCSKSNTHIPFAVLSSVPSFPPFVSVYAVYPLFVSFLCLPRLLRFLPSIHVASSSVSISLPLSVSLSFQRHLPSVTRHIHQCYSSSSLIHSPEDSIMAQQLSLSLSLSLSHTHTHTEFRERQLYLIWPQAQT